MATTREWWSKQVDLANEPIHRRLNTMQEAGWTIFQIVTYMEYRGTVVTVVAYKDV